MGIFERISELARKHGKNVKTVALELDFSENLFYGWKKNQPKAADLAKVADYFHVSLDDLMGRATPKYRETDLGEMLNNAIAYNGQVICPEDKDFIEKFLRTYFETTRKCRS